MSFESFNNQTDLSQRNSEIGKKNEKFDPDARIDKSNIKETEISNVGPFNPDKRIENTEHKARELYTTAKERIAEAKGSNGEWTGAPGNSELRPNNSDAKAALEKYGQTGIEYKDGNPDFSEVSEATVKIDNMTSDRYENFKQADIKCAENWNQERRDERNDWSPREVKTWRETNRYSWHERVDCKTMDLVQRDIHTECKHFGGVSECKRAERVNGLGGGFDE